MKRLAHEVLKAGAVGIITGRTDNHRTANGSPTPASEACERELQALAAALNGLELGVLQAVSEFDMYESPKKFPGEFNILEEMTAAAPGYP